MLIPNISSLRTPYNQPIPTTQQGSRSSTESPEDHPDKSGYNQPLSLGFWMVMVISPYLNGTGTPSATKIEPEWLVSNIGCCNMLQHVANMLQHLPSSPVCQTSKCSLPRWFPFWVNRWVILILLRHLPSFTSVFLEWRAHPYTPLLILHSWKFGDAPILWWWNLIW